jgi:hypothetical protein
VCVCVCVCVCVLYVCVCVCVCYPVEDCGQEVYVFIDGYLCVRE